jgi:hypothetical protein
VGDSLLHSAVCRRKLTVCSCIVTVLFCKPLYSSQAATLSNIGNISGHIL